MHYELALAADGGDEETTVAVDDPYVDVVYGPLIGAIAILILRYLHASLPLRVESTCSFDELAAATGSRPRRIPGPLRRLHRHRLIVIHGTDGAAVRQVDPVRWADDGGALGRLLLPPRLPLASARAIERLPPIAAGVARARRPA